MTMLGYTLYDPGSATVDNYNARAMSILELGAANAAKYSFTLPAPMVLYDFVLTATAVQNHEYQFFIGGQSRGAYIFASQINPASNTRVNWYARQLMFPAGVDIQVRTAQLTEPATAAAEPTAISITFMG